MQIVYKYGRKIRELREIRAWTQEHLAQAASVDCRTIQRAEKDETQSLDTLKAIASAFDVDVSALRSTIRIPESQLVRTELLTSPRQFIASEEGNRSEMFARSVLVPRNDGYDDAIGELWENVFVDREYVEPHETELWRSYVESIRKPLQQLFDSAFAVFVLNERQDFLFPTHFDLKPERDHITMRVRRLMLVPRHGCFRAGRRACLHRFNPDCPDAGNTLFAFASGKENSLHVYPNALPVVAQSSDDTLVDWCDVCFPPSAGGVRIDLDYIEEVTGLSRSKLHEMWMQASGDDSLYGLS